MSTKLEVLNIKDHLRYLRRRICSIIRDMNNYLCYFTYGKKIIEKYKNLEPKIFMERLYFQVTNICNAKCVYCAYPKTKHKQGVMRFETFKKAVDEYVSLGGKVVSLTPTVGEPLIDLGLLDKIRYAVNLKGIDRVYFYTNGILLNKDDMYKKLIDSGIQEIAISMADADTKNYERVFRVLSYDQVIDGVHNLLKYNKEKGEKVAIKISFRPFTGSKGVLQSEDFKKYIKPFVSDKVTYEIRQCYDNWGGAVKEGDLLGVMKMTRPPKFRTLPCMRTFDASILFDGSVRLCGCRFKTTEFDDLVVGNINESNLRDIFFGENAKNIRQRFLTNDAPEACKNCAIYAPINGRWLQNRESGCTK